MVTRGGFIIVATGIGEVVVLGANKSEIDRKPVFEPGETPQAILASPVVNRAGDRVYVVTQHGRIATFSLSSAGFLTPRWSRTLPNLSETPGVDEHEVRATPALSADESTLYVVSGRDVKEPLVKYSDGRIYAFQTAGGSQHSGFYNGLVAWTYVYAHLAPSPVVLSDGKIVVATLHNDHSGNNLDTNGTICAYFPEGTLNQNGPVAWRTPGNQGYFEASPAVGTDDRLFFAQTDRAFRCYNGSNGDLLWQSTLHYYSKSSPVISSFGDVVIADFAGYIYSFAQTGPNPQSSTGSKWEIDFLAWGLSGRGGPYMQACQTPVIDAGGNIIVSDHFGRVVCVTPSGSARWSSAMNAPLIDPDDTTSKKDFGLSSPTMTTSGEVLLLRKDGKLFSFQNEHGPDAGIWPGFQRGSTHSGNIGDNPVDRPGLTYTATAYPGLTEYVWDPQSGGAMQIVNASSVNAANDFGHVAGVSSYQQSYGYKAVEWLSGQVLDFAASYGSSARGINDAGEAVGWRIESSGGSSEAAFWQRAPWGLSVGYPLNSSTEWQSAEARAMNNSRTVVGRAVNTNGTPRAMLWPFQGSGAGGSLHGTGIDLGSFDQGNDTIGSEAVGLSVLNEVGGNTPLTTSSGTWVRPFRFRWSASRPAIELGDRLPAPDFAALGIANGVAPADLRNQVAVTLSRNGQLAGNVQPYASGEAYVPFVHRPTPLGSSAYRVFPEWTFSPSPYPRTYRPTQMLAYNGRGQSLLRADVFDPTVGMQYLGQGYVIHTPTRTGYVDVSYLISSGGGISGLTDDGRIFGWRYQNSGSSYVPTGFVALPTNTP